MTKWQWSVIIALCKVVIKLVEGKEVWGRITEEDTNLLHEAIYRDESPTMDKGDK